MKKDGHTAVHLAMSFQSTQTHKLINAEPAKPAVNKEVGTIVVIYRDEYGNQISLQV